MGGGLAAIGELYSVAQERKKEAELLFVGEQYRNAIKSYYEKSPGGAKRYPQKLEDLLQDSRYPTAQRYLRRVYADPMTGSAWGLMEGPGGGIMGVYSLSSNPPRKTSGFSLANQSFEDAREYSEWKFFYAARSAPAAAPGPSASPSGLAPPR